MLEQLRASLPWFVMEAITYLHDECLEDPDGPLTWHAFEWGSGGSTLWLSQRTKGVVSLEHNIDWYADTRAKLAQYAIENVALLHVPLGQGYNEYILRYPDESFDLVIVDGRERAACIRNGHAKVKPGGIFILDNSEREQYQEAIRDCLGGWERHDFDSGYSEGWSTTVWHKPIIRP